MTWLFSLCLLFTTAFACTAFQLTSLDGAPVYCRSLEFGFPLNSEVLIVPRATQFVATPSSSALRWQVKYGYVGMNQSFLPTLVSDGMNEKGFVVGCLYHPGYAKYQASDPKRVNRALGAADLASFLLATCATVAEAKAVLPTLVVVDAPLPGAPGFSLPLHYYVGDASGAVLIVEYVEGRLKMYDNPVGVLTNSPTFDWHLTNLSNYANLTPSNVPGLHFGAWQAKSFGQGSGALGLPGDGTPPSRFVRAALFAAWATPQKTALDAVRLGFHLLNTFDIAPGTVRPTANAPGIPTPFGTASDETTEWVIVHDQKNLKTYVRSYESLQVQCVDFASLNFGEPGFRRMPLEKQFLPRSLNPEATP